jgi:hypothetical protein
MESTQEYAAEVDRIRSRTRCPRQFLCCQSGFTRMGEVAVIAGGRLLECKAEEAATCPLALSYGDAFFCKCRLRMYISRVFHR